MAAKTEMTKEKPSRGLVARIKDGFEAVFRGSKGAAHHSFKMLLIGETGSGKTSFLNLLYNCGTVQALGCGFGDSLEHFRNFNKIELENAQALSMESKTDDATLYNVQVGELKVGVIDTPGFGDSRGFKQDKTNSQRIINTLKKEGYINCVCMIINGRQSRASASLKYVLSEITALLPRGILDNVIVVFSNTSDPLDLNFDVNLLKDYFGRDVKNIFFVENPYCRFEKAKAKVGQLGKDRVARSLQKAFEETSTTLTEMCDAIKDFPEVHTQRFIELYEKKRAIERSVLASLTAYDNQLMLEKSLKTAKAEVDSAVKSKSLNKNFKTVQKFKKWVVSYTSYHNTICGVKGCHSNCHESCSLPKSFDKEVFKRCWCIDKSTMMCKQCGHSYEYHYHDEGLFKEEEYVKNLISDGMKEKFEKAESDEERAKMIYSNLEMQVKQSKVERQRLSLKLSKDIAEFEKLGAARNYAKLIENQLAVIETHLEGTEVGRESDDLRKTKDEMEKKLKLIKEIKTGGSVAVF